MSSSGSAPEAPDYAKLYQQGVDVYLKNLPRLLQTEANTRATTDPERILQQQALQAQFGSTQYQQQLDALKQLDPESAAIRADLGKRVQSDLALGSSLSPEYARELEQNVRGAQAARGNSLGAGAISVESLVKGRAGQEMYQQRLNNAGSFLSGPTPEQQLLTVQGVQPDRSMAYASPSAGTAGANFGATNYANLLAGQQLQQNNNPWLRAATGAASGAVAGYAGGAGGGWGALGGAAVGAGVGYYSDSRIKYDIREIATTKSGIPLIRFKFLGSPRTFIGARAQDVQKVRPDAVILDKSGYLKVDYGKLADVPYFELGRN